MRWFEFAVDCKNPDGKRSRMYIWMLCTVLVCRTPCRQPCLRIPRGIATARAAGFATVGIYDEPMAEFWPQITQTADFASRTWQDWLQNVQQTGPAPRK